MTKNLLGATHRRLQGGGQGGHGPPPKGLTKMIEMAQFAAFCNMKKNFPRGHAPRPQ